MNLTAIFFVCKHEDYSKMLRISILLFRLEEPSSIRTSDIDEERVRLTDGSRNIAVLEGRKNAVSASVLRRELELLKVCKR
jgi:hypothetical protein